MGERKAATKWVRLNFPSQYRIGLRGLAEQCDWRVREVGGSFLVASSERYTETRSDLVRLKRLAHANAALDTFEFDHFNRWQRQDHLADPAMLEMVMASREVRSPATVADGWVAFRLQFMVMPDADVAGYVRDLFHSVAPHLPHASLWAVDVDRRFQARVAATRALFTAQQSPEVLAALDDEATHGARRMMAGYGLSPSWTYGQAIFVEPPLLVASPWVTGISSYRAGGSAIILFGDVEPGFVNSQAAEGLDVFRSMGIVQSRQPVQRPSHQSDAYEASLRWWFGRLNDLCGIALDVGRFSGPDGTYRAASQLGVLVSLERLFASLETLLTEAGRGELIRLMLFFDIIDLLEGLGFGSWESMLRRDKVERDLERLEAVLPGEARELFLTRCRPAVAALGELERGFARGRVSGSMVRVRQRDGVGWQEVPLHSAVASFLRLARNSTHSFREMAKDPRDMSLFAAHDGEIPDAVSDLALLHVLRLLAAPHLPS